MANTGLNKPLMGFHISTAEIAHAILGFVEVQF
jgi:hypothetical protein